jgi:hypothetical protein
LQSAIDRCRALGTSCARTEDTKNRFDTAFLKRIGLTGLCCRALHTLTRSHLRKMTWKRTKNPTRRLPPAARRCSFIFERCDCTADVFGANVSVTATGRQPFQAGGSGRCLNDCSLSVGANRRRLPAAPRCRRMGERTRGLGSPRRSAFDHQAQNGQRNLSPAAKAVATTVLAHFGFRP